MAIDTDESPELFKTQIFSQTGVPPDRQKIMVKGGMLKVRWCLWLLPGTFADVYVNLGYDWSQQLKLERRKVSTQRAGAGDSLRYILTGSFMQGHTFMMMGTAGELPKAPAQPVKFLEDMTNAEVAEAVSTQSAYVFLLYSPCHLTRLFL